MLRPSPYILLILAVLLCSCERGRESGRTVAGGPAGAASSYTLEVLPHEASRSDTVRLVPRGFAVANARIDWLLNGLPAESATPDRFSLSQANKGDTLQAKALVQGEEVLSNTITVGNAPPEITGLTFLIDSTKPGNALGVAVTGGDADGDPVSYEYQWTINGKPAGTGARIGEPVKHGDTVVVRVTPFDGESYGRPAMLERRIENMPPVIQEHTDFQFDGSRYAYQVEATDPDGDPLHYAIAAPEPGMAIDEASGLFTWNVPKSFTGTKSVPIVVTDGHGGTTTYTIQITIR